VVRVEQRRQDSGHVGNFNGLAPLCRLDVLPLLSRSLASISSENREQRSVPYLSVQILHMCLLARRNSTYAISSMVKCAGCATSNIWSISPSTALASCGRLAELDLSSSESAKI
jgi:hypothetical protein